MALQSLPRVDDVDQRYLPCVSPQMQALTASLARVAATEAPVLICGETGTGKSTLARQVYEDSPRRSLPLLVLHSATATAEAVDGLLGLGEQTVLIEEIGELAPSVQDSLVRVLSGMPARGGLRLITTTSGDLSALTRRNGMRADLLYRLDVVRLEIPPLRHRPEDIIFLAEHFLMLAARRFRREVRAFSPDACAQLLGHPWHGNVRELRNCIAESVLHCPHVRLRAADLRIRSTPSGSDPDAELRAILSRLHGAHPAEFHGHIQRLVLQWALQTSGGNRIRAAALLGIGRGALRAKLRRYGLDGAHGQPISNE